jgi:hypothetical protein
LELRGQCVKISAAFPNSTPFIERLGFKVTNTSDAQCNEIDGNLPGPVPMEYREPQPSYLFAYFCAAILFVAVFALALQCAPGYFNKSAALSKTAIPLEDTFPEQNQP